MIVDASDVEAFVNSVLSEALEEGMDAKISGVSMKLQLMSADLSDELETAMEELAAAAPRAQVEARQIVRALEGVNEEVDGVSRRAAKQVSREGEVLEELERLRRNLREAEEILSARRAWDAQAEEIGGKLALVSELAEAEVVAEELAAMRRAEKVLAHLPGAEERRRWSTDARDQMEAALRPRVARGENLRTLAAIYRNLDLSDSLRRDYAAARPAALHRKWFARPRDSEALGPWLGGFLDDARALVAAEREACVLDEPVAAMVAMAIFAPLASSFSDRLAMLDVADLAECRELCSAFCADACLDDDDDEEVSFAVCAPFDEAVKNYERLESEYLVKVTTARHDDGRDDFEAVLSRSERAVEGLFEDMDAAAGRCYVLSAGVEAAGLLKACRDATTTCARLLAANLEKLVEKFVPGGLPLDTSLVSDCWAYAKLAFRAISLAGRLETKLSDHALSLSTRIRTWCRDLLSSSDEGRGGGNKKTSPFSSSSSSRAEIERLLTSGATLSPFDRVVVERALDALSAQASKVVFELAFSPIRAALRRVSSSADATLSYCRPAVWLESQAPAQPNEYVTVVGSHLTSALHELEPFLAGDAVRDALAARVDAAGRNTDAAEWASLGDTLELTDADRLGLRSLASGLPIDGVTLPDGAKEPETPAEDGAVHRFCQDWLACLQRATIAALLDQLVRVEQIDALGSAKLASDLKYLIHVSNTLDLPNHAVLDHLLVLATTTRKPDLDALLRRDLPDNSPAANVLRKIEMAFATARTRGDLGV